jgi:hypothetical protein
MLTLRGPDALLTSLNRRRSPCAPDASISRRGFVESVAAAGLATWGLSSASGCVDHVGPGSEVGAPRASELNQMNGGVTMSDEIVKAKIRRALLSGPECITRDATVVEMGADGKTTVLRPGTNHWVCIPGNENVIGATDMCADPMGMQWMMDVMARKPRPTNTTPGLIYMLNGALQHSYTDPFDRTSPPIPIGPHWMILWPFDATAAGLPTVMRDAGTMVMFAGTPYAHLHVCGSPWEGNEYHPGDRAVWTMKYARP